jgi:dynein heavy chain
MNQFLMLQFLVKYKVLIFRCNDVLELVQTTRHFRLLADAAEVGGAGSASLDALVKEIHTKYAAAMDAFFSKVSNVLSIDGTQSFEKAFFTFRTIVKVGCY